MKAFILCAGLGTRMHPLTHMMPKASMPFLNLPLLSYGMFYLEQMGLKEVVCNSHLFPDLLKDTLAFLTSQKKSSSIVFEPQSLGSAGGLYNARSFLEKEETFLYLNSDSLFFPSSLGILKKFKEDFLSSSFESSFFASPMKSNDQNKSGLWIDEQGILYFVGSKMQLPPALKTKKLRLVKFSGLAWFRSSFLKNLKATSNHIFLDVINHQLDKKTHKVFVDEQALILEAGQKQDYLEASQLCLEKFFNEKESSIKEIICSVFNRFDPKDEQVGASFSKQQFQKNKKLLLTSKKVKGLEHLKVGEFAVLGPQVKFLGKSYLSSCVLWGPLAWKGTLEKQILIKRDF